MTFKNYNKYNAFLETNPNFTGVCVILHSNGQKEYEYNLVNRKYHGKQVSWNKKGKKLLEHNFTDGKPHGKQLGGHPNGKKLYENSYVYGIQIGIQFFAGVTYETKPEDNPKWYVIVEEIL